MTPVANLFVLDITYQLALTEVDRHQEGHRAYLRRNYDAGMFLASGPKLPRTGGIILATGERSAIEKITETDPFVAHGVATYTVTEFAPLTTGPELAAFQRQA
jgi:uncharacterized protein YciI